MQVTEYIKAFDTFKSTSWQMNKNTEQKTEKAVWQLSELFFTSDEAPSIPEEGCSYTAL